MAAGFTLLVSNSTEALGDALGDAVAAQREAASPAERAFETTQLVVPGREIEGWLRRRLAARLGVAVNLRMELASGLLARLAAVVAPDSRILDRRALEGLVLERLADDAFIARPEMQALAAWLEVGDASESARARRQTQLARRLARLFDAWLGDRPELADSRATSAGAAPRWQLAFLRALVAEAGAGETRWITADRLLAEAPTGALRGALPATLHLFTPAPGGRGLPRLCAHLARACDVRVYWLHPCRELAEDLIAVRRPVGADRHRFPALAATAGSQLNADPADPMGLIDPADPAPLGAWGRASREALRLLLQVPGARWVSLFREPAADAPLLGRLQRDLVRRERGTGAHTDADRLRGDGSVSLVEAPSLRREIESVAAAIWKRVDAPGMTFADIAVLVPGDDVATYQSLVSVVFREAGDIPHRLLGARLAGTSRLCEAFLAAVSLLHGTWARQEVGRFLIEPSVLAGMPGATTSSVITLLDDMGVIQGKDRGDQRGTYIDRDLFNWEQGLRRLVLGAHLAGPREGNDHPFVMAGDAYAPLDLPMTALPAALGVARVVRRLLDEARFILANRLPLAGWVRRLRALGQELLIPSDADDERALATCLRELRALEEMPVAAPMPYAVAAELATHALSSLAFTRTSHATIGVTVAPLVAVRGVPFRAVFVVGMGAGQFPAAANTDELDVRETRRPGEVGAPDRDVGLFLDAVHSAGAHLTLSYVARDERVGETLEPSTVVAQTCAFIEDHALGPGGSAALRLHPPLARHEDRSAREVLAEAGSEMRAFALGEALRAAGATVPRQPADIPGVLGEAATAALEEPLGLVLPLAGAPIGNSRRVAAPISLASLRRFLECPLQGSARALLGLRDDDDDAEPLDVTDEPLVAGAREGQGLLTAAFSRAVALAADPYHLDDAALAESYAEVTRLARLAGRLPIGPPGEALTRVHLAMLALWARGLAALGAEASAPPQFLRWGGGPASEPAEAITRRGPAVWLPPSVHAARLRDDPRLRGEAALAGRTDLVVQLRNGGRATLLPTVFAKSDMPRVRKLSLRAWIDHLALSAFVAEGADRPHRAFIVRPHPDGGDRAPETIDFAPLSVVQARAALRALVDEVLDHVHAYLLPCEAVFSYLRKRDRPLSTFIAEARDNTRAGMSSLYGPVPNPRSYPIPPEHEGVTLVEQRFSAYLAT